MEKRMMAVSCPFHKLKTGLPALTKRIASLAIAPNGIALSLDVKPSDVRTGPNKVFAHMRQAASLLQISIRESGRLFLEYEWPDRFQGGITPQTRAKRAVARIDFFIKTKGTDRE